MTAYDELGAHGRELPASYDEAKWHDCTTCGALMMEPCINPITGRKSHHPCVSRIPTGSSEPTETP